MDYADELMAWGISIGSIIGFLVVGIVAYFTRDKNPTE